MANLARSVNKITNPDQLEVLDSPSYHAIRCSDETVKRAF